MKVKCNFCGNMINDTLDKCPDCGAPNEHVRRVAEGTPKTIEELQAWYESKGLPPAKTTRFFIGEDYKGARAFGIYHDKTTGNFVVYKNKDSGERAVRYEGTDEAYAVNELYQRLKQEILEQKRNSANKNGKANNKVRKALATGKNKKEYTLIGRFLNLISPSNYDNFIVKAIMVLIDLALAGFVFLMGVLLLIFIMGMLIIAFEPKEGYYSCAGDYYYRNGYTYNGCNWYEYDQAIEEWSDGLEDGQYPSELDKKRKANKLYICENWDASLNCTDFTTTLQYRDSLAGDKIQTGYYKYDDDIYYHLTSSYDDGWYTYDGYGWTTVNSSELPEDFSHTSVAEDFYYTPVWDESTQFTDFEDTILYAEDKDNWDNDSSSSDSSYDWDSSSDSWDSGSTDWGSDW